MSRLLFIIMISAACAAFAQWPQLHGPARDNMSKETGFQKEWPKDGLKLLWKYTECGKGYAMPAILDGKIYLTGDFGDTEKIIALDLDGKLDIRHWNELQVYKLR